MWWMVMVINSSWRNSFPQNVGREQETDQVGFPLLHTVVNCEAVFCLFSVVFCVWSRRTSTWWRDILLQNSVGELRNSPLCRWLWNLQVPLLHIFLHLNVCLSHSLCSADVPTKSYALKPCLTFVFKQTTHKTWGQGSFASHLRHSSHEVVLWAI